MSIEITFTIKNETIIKRWDRDNTNSRTYTKLTASSSKRLGNFIAENKYDDNGVFGHYHTYKCIIEPIARKHYFMLNQEYQKGTMVGRIWEINEDIYWDALESLSPLKYVKNGFLMREFMIGNITTKFTNVNGQYYCEFVEFGQ